MDYSEEEMSTLFASLKAKASELESIIKEMRARPDQFTSYWVNLGERDVEAGIDSLLRASTPYKAPV